MQLPLEGSMKWETGKPETEDEVHNAQLSIRICKTELAKRDDEPGCMARSVYAKKWGMNPMHGRKSPLMQIFYPGHRSRKEDNMVSQSATEKSTGLSGVGGILRQAQTASLCPPTPRLCTSLKFSKIAPDRVDEGERGDCIRRGKS